MKRTWRSAAVGTSSGLAARMLRLPFNARLRAYNMFEVAVDRGVIDEVAEFYSRHVAPALDRPDGSFRTGRFSLFAKSPGWGSDLKFWSPDDLPTYRYFEDVFRRLAIDARRFPGVDPAIGLRAYSASLMTRSWCEATHFHTDFFPTCSSAVYTLITPLGDPSPRNTGQLMYRDADGRERVYEYRKGAAVAFGSLLSHGTQAYPPSGTQAFLSFTFATDSPGRFGAIKRALDLKRTLDYCGCWQGDHLRERRAR